MSINEAILKLEVRGHEIARLQRRLHASRERYKKVRAELRRCLFQEMTTAKFLRLMESRVAGDAERMNRISEHNRKITEENRTLQTRIQELEIFIEGAKGKYL